MELAPIDTAAAREIALDPAGWTPDRQARFLSLLAENGNVRASALVCGLSPQSVYKLRRRDALFARSWQAAVLLARDHSEQVLADRALEGVEEPVFYRGEQVGVRRRYDTRLLLAHMARLDRLADEASEADACRFDELLALVAGERPPEALAEALAEMPDGEDLHLPPTIDEHVETAVKAAKRAKEAQLPWERSKEKQAERERAIEAAAEAAHADAERAWNDWFDRACAAVDRIDAAGPSFRARTVSTVSTAAVAGAQAIGFGGAPLYARA